MTNPRLSSTVDRLITEGADVLAASRPGGVGDIVDSTLFAKWLPGCRNLLRMLGPYAEPWSEAFVQSADFYEYSRAEQMQGTLQAIKEAIGHNLLLDTEDLILADTFNNLLGQAEYLCKEGYFLAAGVLGRAVLEEHLRKWAQHAKCLPSAPKPTINSYTKGLYSNKQFTVTVLKHIEAIASIGNDAAHNKSTLTKEDVNRLLRDLREFLLRHSLSTSVT